VDYTALQGELSARGFSRLSATRLGQYVNEGRQLLDNAYPWPYRLTTATGASPLTVTDLGVIDEVTNTLVPGGAPLEAVDRRTLRAQLGDVTLTGTPSYYYVDGTSVKTYPVGGTLFVRYFKRCPALSSGTDVPLAPSDYHMLIVDLAEREALRGKGDLQAAAAVSAVIAEKLGRMVGDLFAMQAATGPSAEQDLWNGSVDG
jgi:hypothetical protein